MMKYKTLFLILTFLVAAFLRLYQLDFIPPSPSLDEVSIGYNAYSILHTGKDEYGNFMPILLRAYDDFRPALYVYLVVPSVFILGLSAVAVRIPAVLLSLLVILSMYFLVDSLLKLNNKNESSLISLFAVILLAISPWDVYISRLGHEANAAFAFFIFGLTFFFIFIRGSIPRKNIFLLFSALFFALSFYAYQSTKVVVPLIIISLGVMFSKKLVKNLKLVIFSVLLGTLILIPVLISTLGPQGLIRFKGTNLFTANQNLGMVSAQRQLRDNSVLSKVYNNRRVTYSLFFLNAYLSHFNPTWLFFNSGNEPFKVPDLGLFYIFEIPLLVLGLIETVRKDVFNREVKLFFVAWLIIAIVPGAITTGYPHAMRIFNLLPLPQIIEAVGFMTAFLWVTKKTNKYFTVTFSVLFILFLGFWLFEAYFVNFPKELSEQFQYGTLQALSFGVKNQNKYDKVIVSNKDSLFQSYMFYLFETRYDPLKYLADGGTKSGGFDNSHQIGKFSFQSINGIKITSHVLYIVNPGELNTTGLRLIKNIHCLDGKICEQIFSS